MEYFGGPLQLASSFFLVGRVITAVVYAYMYFVRANAGQRDTRHTHGEDSFGRP